MRKSSSYILAISLIFSEIAIYAQKSIVNSYTFNALSVEHEIPYWQESIKHTFVIMKQQKFLK